MKKRIQNWITSIIGAILLLTGTAMIIATYFVKVYDFTIVEYTGVLALGYVFLVAKDSLIEGLLFNTFKKSK